MTFTRRNWRGNFGSRSSAANGFSKIEQVKKLESVLKFATPKDKVIS
jgi:hypothetical protein